MRVYTGLDLSRQRLDWHACRVDGTLVDAGAVPPDLDGLAQLVHRLGDGEVVAVVEMINGARFIHDRLELAGWDVRIADAQRARALAPLACKTDRIDAQVLAELARRDLVPEVWLPDPRVRGERERARFRLHLVKHRTMLKNRINQTPGRARPRPADPAPVRAKGPRRARAAAAAGAVAGDAAGEPCPDRLAGRADRRARARAARARRRPPVRAAASHRARDRLDPRLHNRQRDRRHQPLPHRAQTERLHRPVPARLPIR